MNNLNILCIGGDARFKYMCRELSSKYRVYAYKTISAPEGAIMLGALDDMKDKADVLVLPMLNNTVEENGRIGLPCCDGTVFPEDMIPLLSDNAIVTGGLADEKTVTLFRSFGYEITDYFKRHDLIVKNCIPTAEGALMIAIQESEETVSGSRILISGFGNVAKALARLFSACGGIVTCAVRRNDAAAEAECAGYHTVGFDKLKEAAAESDIILNTVPAVVIDEEVLMHLNKSALVIDLASRPGGVDFEAADRLGIKCIHALALPGKVAPVTAGRYIAETVDNIISERRG